MAVRPSSSSVASHTAALLAAALAPALLWAASGLAFYVFAIALAHALLLGFPLYLLARRFGRMNLPNALWVSGCVGAAPLTLLALVMGPDQASSGDTSTWINGVPTLAGGLQMVFLAAVLGLTGAVGGLAFWAVLKWSAPGASSALAAPRRWRRAHAVAVGALAFAGLVLASPWALQDRSCHNPLIGRDSIAPEASIDLDIAREDWPSLTAELRTFAGREGLSFRDGSELSPGVVQVLSTSICAENRVVMSADDQHWFGSPDLGVPGGPSVLVYNPSDASWRPLWRRLSAQLERKWPGRVRASEVDASPAIAG